MPKIVNGTEPDDARSDDARTVLHAQAIEKTYDSWLPIGRTGEVLDGADFDLAAGEIIGIVGANGSGKSTLMKILVGALAPDAGTIERPGTIGWCPQDSLLYDRRDLRSVRARLRDRL